MLRIPSQTLSLYFLFRIISYYGFQPRRHIDRVVRLSFLSVTAIIIEECEYIFSLLSFVVAHCTTVIVSY